MGHAQCFKGRVGPDVTTAQVAGGCVDGTDDQDTLDGTVDESESQGLRVILVPGLDIERQASCKLRMVSISVSVEAI